MRANAFPERHPLSELYGSLEPMAGIGTWRYTFKSRHLVWSHGLYRLFGLEGTVAPSYDLFARMTHPDDRVPIEDLGAYLDEVRIIDRDFRVVRQNGTIRWLTHKAEVFVDEDGAPFVALGVLVDITARVEAKRARDAAESRLRSVTQVTRCFTWLTRRDGQKPPSQGWMDLTGQSVEESSGEGWLTAIHEDDRRRTQQAWREAVATHSAYKAAYRLFCRDGTLRWFIARALPVFDERGELLEWHGVAMDISDVKSLDAPLVDIGGGRRLTGSIIRAARALLDWTVRDLSSHSRVSTSTIKRLEGEAGQLTATPLLGKLIEALVLAGVEFLESDGCGASVRLSSEAGLKVHL